MSETKHTSGPWSVFVCDDGGVWTGWPLSITADSVTNSNGDGRLIVRTGGMWPYAWDNGTSIDEANANARLIAAAPDLMQALKSIIAIGEHRPQNIAEAQTQRYSQWAVDIARSAINIAEGRS